MKKRVIFFWVLIIVFLFGMFLFYQKENIFNQRESNNTENSEVNDKDIFLEVVKVAPEIDTRYISKVDWPPKVWLNTENYSCAEAGEPEARTGESKLVSVQGREWCRTLVSEGAAGSVYNQYSYTRPVLENTQVVNFSLRFVQCANYDELEKNECESERENFNVDNIISEMF